MKKKEKIVLMRTAAMIYRFVFILFCVWGICQTIGFNILALSAKILSFALVTDILCFLCILLVFFASISGSAGRLLRKTKEMLTFCAVIVLLGSASSAWQGLPYEWTLGMLLPAMMVIDWLLFDKKGNLNFYDLFLWLLTAALLMGLLAFVLSSLFGIEEIFSILGLFDSRDAMLKLFGKALGIGFAMFLIDCIANAFSKKSFRNIFSVIYRLAFIALEAYALSHTAGTQLKTFLYSMRYYHILTNFLCAVCIGVLVVYNLVKFKSLKKTANPFPSAKGAFTLAVIVAMLGNLFYGRSVISLSLSEIILYYIAPVMMFLDWILFDYKGRFEIYDPLLWLLIPAGYYLYALLCLKPVQTMYAQLFNFAQPERILSAAVTIIAVGYAIFVADRLLAKGH